MAFCYSIVMVPNKRCLHQASCSGLKPGTCIVSNRCDHWSSDCLKLFRTSFHVDEKRWCHTSVLYRVLWILKAMWIILSETINILRKLPKKHLIFGMPQKCYHRFMYIAPSSGEPLPNINLPIKWILRRFDVVFWCLETGVRMLHFLKDWWKSIQIHQYYTMALTPFMINDYSLPNSYPSFFFLLSQC